MRHYHSITLRLLLISLMVTSLAVSSLAAVPTGETVNIEGVGAILLGDSARARDEAIRDGYRKAVETLGVYIDAQTVVKDFQVFYDRVTAQTRGYVQGYKIVREWKTDDDIYHVIMTATVVKGNIKGDIEGLTTLIAMMGNPVVAVDLSEEIEGDRVTSPQVEPALLSSLSNAGYHILDSHINSNDSTASGASIVITGTIKAKEFGRYETTQYTIVTSDAVAELRAVQRTTGKVIWSVTQTARERGLTPQAAGTSAIKALTLPLTEKLIWSLPSSYMSDNGRPIKVTLTGLTFSDSLAAIAQVKALRSVVAVNTRCYSDSSLELDVTTTGMTEDLAIRLANIADLKFEIIRVTGDEVLAKLKR